jgi:hypothetical protein
MFWKEDPLHVMDIMNIFGKQRKASDLWPRMDFQKSVLKHQPALTSSA